MENLEIWTMSSFWHIALTTIVIKVIINKCLEIINRKWNNALLVIYIVFATLGLTIYSILYNGFYIGILETTPKFLALWIGSLFFIMGSNYIPIIIDIIKNKKYDKITDLIDILFNPKTKDNDKIENKETKQEDINVGE